jgi:hypothetical protein
MIGDILHATSPASWLGWTDFVVFAGALVACSAAAFPGRRDHS